MNLCQGISTASLRTHYSLLYIVSVLNKSHYIVFRSSRTILAKLSEKSARKALTFVIPCFSLAPSCLPRRFLRQLPRESSSHFESSVFSCDRSATGRTLCCPFVRNSPSNAVVISLPPEYLLQYSLHRRSSGFRHGSAYFSAIFINENSGLATARFPR